MSSKIHPLPIDVVHLMAAGEVIDSLAAVVRELVENALDAGATRIFISLWPDQWKIRVVDNGVGMVLSDLQRSALPHCTSKIQASEDLWQIHSLGFRGEALYSLAQLADLEIGSRWVNSNDGWWVTYNHQGEPIQVDVVAIAPGTITTVSNLFGEWLPRREALPSFVQQLRAVQSTIQKLALCHPHVTWRVEQNDREWFSIWSGTTAHQILPQLIKDLHPNDLQEWQGAIETATQGSEDNVGNLSYALRPETQGTGTPQLEGALSSRPMRPSIYLLMGLPDRCHRHRPDWVKVAVNGRVVKIPELEQTVIAAFRRTLPRDRHPVCFLHLQVPPYQVDWNRHPAKAEIYLNPIEYWQDYVAQAIHQALQRSLAELPSSAHASRVNQVIKTAESQGTYAVETRRRIIKGREETPESKDSSKKLSISLSSPSVLTASPTASPLPSLKAVAQVHNRYILVEHPAGVWLIEQHIAHERVLYEQLCDRWHLVPLQLPLVLSQLSSKQVEQLQRLEIDIEPFGDDLWAVRTAPEALAGRQDCLDALVELSLGGDLESALVATACRTAIRNGTPLTLTEMQTLVEQWQQTRHPRTCPHGRPICLMLEESSLSRFFRRHWVIGKSHGI